MIASRVLAVLTLALCGCGGNDPDKPAHVQQPAFVGQQVRRSSASLRRCPPDVAKVLELIQAATKENYRPQVGQGAVKVGNVWMTLFQGVRGWASVEAYLPESDKYVSISERWDEPHKEMVFVALASKLSTWRDAQAADDLQKAKAVLMKAGT